MDFQKTEPASDMTAIAPETIEFKADHKRPSIWASAFLVFMGVAWLLSAGSLRGSGLWMLLPLLVMAWPVWYLVKQLLDKAPWILVSTAGVALRGQARPLYRWDEIHDVTLERVQNTAILRLELVSPPGLPIPRTSWTGKNPLRPHISLHLFKPATQDAALTAIQQRLSSQRAATGQGVLPSIEAAHRQSAMEARLLALTPQPWALYVVVAINVAVWAWGLVQGLDPMKPATSQLFAWGANSTYAVRVEHEYWRMLTATFLHGGVLHLALNMLGLWEAGRQVSRWYGNGRFLLIYFVAALAGSALSLHFSAAHAVSVGASGAVFGVLGALIVVAVRHRNVFRSDTAKQLLYSQGFFLVYALVQGFGKQGIDNAAHVGGLAAGMIMAWCLPGTLAQEDEAANVPAWRPWVGLVACVAALAAGIGAAPAQSTDFRTLLRTEATMARLADDFQKLSKELLRDGERAKAEKWSDERSAELIRSRYLPALSALNREWAALRLPPQDSRTGLLAAFQTLGVSLEQSMALELEKSAPGADLQSIDARQKALAATMAQASEQIKKITQAAKAPKR